MSQDKQYAVQMYDICKSFGAYTVLDNMKLEVEKGTIHAILGANGAGKTTLMNILYGLYSKDSGRILVNGKECDIKNAQVAIANGIGMVHQSFKLIDNFTVFENIILGSESTKAFGVLDVKKARRRVERLRKRYDFWLDLDATISDISVGAQQKVEILKSLYKGVDILILDEPTSILTDNESEGLMTILNNLVADNKTVIIISHKVGEAVNCADNFTVMRYGKNVNTFNKSEVSKKEIAYGMIGENVDLSISKEEFAPGECVFKLSNLNIRDKKGIKKVDNVSLNIRKGEIFGIVGFANNGQREIVDAVSGLTKCESGTITINGNEIQNTNPGFVRKNNASMLHIDKLNRGLVHSFTVAENTVLDKYTDKRFSSVGHVNVAARSKFAEEIVKDYEIVPVDLNQPAYVLSGGNQQKLMIAREMSNDTDFILLGQPTKGLDFIATCKTHKKILSERSKGKAILLISQDIDEVISLSDTIAVISDGKIIATMDAKEAEKSKILLLMTGGVDECMF